MDRYYEWNLQNICSFNQFYLQGNIDDFLVMHMSTNMIKHGKRQKNTNVHLCKRGYIVVTAEIKGT